MWTGNDHTMSHSGYWLHCSLIQSSPVGLFIVFPNKLLDFLPTYQIPLQPRAEGTLPMGTQPSCISKQKNNLFILKTASYSLLNVLLL